jgi:guanine nucleotide-binding protein G(i) subunit alpha
VLSSSLLLTRTTTCSKETEKMGQSNSNQSQSQSNIDTKDDFVEERDFVKESRTVVDGVEPQEDNHLKFLLLGTSQSGKTTIFKHVRHMYGRGWPQEDRLDYVLIVKENIIQMMNQLMELVTFPPDSSEFKAAEMIQRLSDSSYTLDPDQGRVISLLWNNSSVKQVWEKRRLETPELCYNEMLQYWCENIERISSSSYIPSVEDVLKARKLTLGASQSAIFHLGKHIRLTDIGGKRNIQDRWSRYFEHCDVIIFVVDISHMDLPYLEALETKCIAEDLLVFEKLAQNRQLKDVYFILFFNQMPQFEKKILHHQISLFPEYSGENVDEAMKNIKAQFLERMPKSKKLHFLVGDALKQEDVNSILSLANSLMT